MTPPADPSRGPADDPDRDHDDGEPDEDAPPDWFPGGHLPEHARRLGLTHHVPEGALLDFAGRLDSAKPLHRATAWVMLGVFATPPALYVLRLLEAAYPG